MLQISTRDETIRKLNTEVGLLRNTKQEKLSEVLNPFLSTRYAQNEMGANFLADQSYWRTL